MAWRRRTPRWLGERGAGRQAGLGADLDLDGVGDVRVLREEHLGVGPALAEALVVVAEERAALGDDVVEDAEVEQRAFARDALAVGDVELGLLERRRDLVLDDLDADAVAHGLGAVLERLDAADVEPDGGVELERLAAGGDLRVAEHDADLLAQLVGEGADRARAAQAAVELAQRLAHEPRLQADEAVAHLALDLGLGRERGDGVDGDDVEGAAAHQHLGDLERLLAVVRLRDQQVVDVDADGLGVDGVHGVLGVDERRLAAELLRLGDEVVDHGRLARGLRTEDLDDAAARDAADAEGDVERQRAGGHELHVVADRVVAETHDAALAELAVDLGDGGLEGFVFVQGSAPLLLRTRESLLGGCALLQPVPGGYYTRPSGRHQMRRCSRFAGKKGDRDGGIWPP